MVEFVRYWDDIEPQRNLKKFNITIPPNVPVADNKGSDFEMKIRIVSKKGPARNLAFQFGVKDESLYIKKSSQ